MIKISIVLLALTISAASFQIAVKEQETAEISQIGAIPWPFTICGDGDWTIESLTLDQTPKRNINDNFVMTGTAKTAIAFKRAELTVKLNGAFLDKQTPEFTNSYDAGDSIEFTFSNFIPGFAPPGTYSLSFQFIDSKEKNNGCLQFQFKL